MKNPHTTVTTVHKGFSFRFFVVLRSLIAVAIVLCASPSFSAPQAVYVDPASGAIVNTTDFKFKAHKIQICDAAGNNCTAIDTDLDGKQPLDSDLTAIAGISTTSFGRNALTIVDAPAFRTYIGAGTSSFDGAFGSLTGKPTTIAGYGIADFNSLGDARWQPLDPDLTIYAGITPSANAQTLLGHTFTLMRSDLSLVIGTNVEAWDPDLDTYAANTPTTTGLNLVKLANPGAITFLKIAADNSVSAESAATHRTSLGLAIGTNVQAWDADLDAIAALAGTSGFLKKTGANTWSLDTNTYLTGNQSISITGDASGSGTTAITLTLSNIPTGTTMAGSLLATAIAAPGTPAAGKGSIYVDSTSKNIAVKDDAGVVKHGVQTKTAVASNFATAINDAGQVTVAQPAFTDVSGTLGVTQGGNGLTTATLGDLRYGSGSNTLSILAGNITTTKKYLSQTGNASVSAAPAWAQIAFGDLSGSVAASQMPALTGDATTSAGAVATTVTKINGIDQTTAWTTYTPTVTANTGTITTVGTVTGNYKQIGKTVFFRVAIGITTNGTGATAVRASLPVAAKDVSQVFSGREGNVTGKQLAATLSPDTSTLYIINYDNTYPASNGCNLLIQGVYEAN